jgi:multidrug resistance efflux pump
MDQDATAFAQIVEGLAQAQRDLEDLERTRDILNQANNVFTPDEIASLEKAISRRSAELAAATRDMETRQVVYQTKVVRLREMIRLRDEVIGRLDDQYGIMDRFPEETDVLVATQSRLELDLQRAQAELHR